MEEKKVPNENEVNIEIEEKNQKDTKEQPNEEENKEIKNLQDQIKQLQEKLQKTEDQAKKLSNLYQTLQQDFERYKVRTLQEKQQAKDEGLLKIAKGLLEIVDNFEKAIESAKVSDDISALTKGVQMIHYQLVKFLQENGIEEIIAQGQFNPNEHEVLDTYITTEYEPNCIVKVLQKGYKYKGKVIRPAKVVVALPPEEENEEIT